MADDLSCLFSRERASRPDSHLVLVRVLEPELDEERPLYLADALVVKVPKRSTSATLKLLSGTVPLDMIGWPHLKRVRKDPADVDCVEVLVSRADGSCADILKRLTPGETKTALEALLKASLVVRVPVHNAPCRQRLAEWAAVWPMNLRTFAPEHPLPDEQLQRYYACMQLAMVLSDKGEGDHPADHASMASESTRRVRKNQSACSSGTTFTAHEPHSGAERSRSGAVLVDPRTGLVVATASGGICTGFMQRAKRSHSHPLRHTVMRLVDIVAQRDAANEPRRTSDVHELLGLASPPVTVAKTSVAPAEQPSDRTSPDTKRQRISDHVGPAAHKCGDAKKPDDDGAGAGGSKTDGKPVHLTEYLFTGLELHLTHEPCIMCCMALVHSRVERVVFLSRAPSVGGLCSLTRLQTIKSLNHRYEVFRWTLKRRL